MLLRSLLVLLACLSLAFSTTPAQAAQVQLAWDAPVQANGTPVSNVAGYKLYYGSQSGQYQTVVSVGLTTTYTMKDLSAGPTYYFAVKAYDSTGTESAFSNEISVILPADTPGEGLIPQQQMRVVSVDSQEQVGENGAATHAIDGNATTFWHTAWSRRAAPLPHSLVLDLGGQYQVDGLRYLPRQDGSPNGTIASYQFYVSDNGSTWGTAVAAGTFAAATTEKIVRFTAKTGRYVRLVALSEINGNPWTSVAELNIFGAAVPSSTTTTSSLLAPSVTTSPVTSSPSTSTTVGTSTTPPSPTTASPANSTTASATVASLTSSASTSPMTTSQNTRWEMTLTSTQTYANPFLDVTVTVEYTKAGAPPLYGYGFWDGDATFKLRQAFPEPGHWHYKTTATDPANRGLHRIFTWANFLHLIVNKSVKCDFLKEPSGYKPLIMEKSNT
jgi:F5/8 type C domain/Domain of unknown function (DUF5060)/Fibronectin type III domain